jgi:membrane associated rhomboid family serine protease
MSLRDDLRMQWRAGGNLTRLILVNLGVFVALILIYVILLIPAKGLGPEAHAMRHDWVVKYLQAPSDLGTLITRPWSLVTYMFLHLRLGHIFWNMLILYWMGRIFQDLLGGRRLLGNYLLGGLSGVLLFILFSNLTTPEDRGLPMVMGASGAVMSVLVGIATYRPTAEIHLLLLGPVKLMYIALALVLLDFMGVGSGDGVAHEAHIGGALYGFVAARQLKRGNDWSKGFVDMLEAIGRAVRPRKGPRMKVAKKPARNVHAREEAFHAAKADKQARVDAILDKISRSGYDSLSKEEKDFLFKASK